MNKRNHNIETDNMIYTYKDVILGRLVVFHLYIMLCKNMLAAANEVLAGYNGMMNISIAVMMMLLYIAVFVCIFRNDGGVFMPKRTIVVIFFLVLYITVSHIFVHDLFQNGGVRGDIRSFLSYGLPLFVLVSMMDSPGIIMEYLYKYRGIVFVFASIGFVLYELFRKESGMYGMSYGYSAMFICLVYLYRCVIYADRRDLFFFFTLFCYIFIVGSRGPIFYIGLTILVLVLLRMKGRKKYYMIITGSILLLLMFPAYCYLQAHFSELRAFAGYFSRNLAMILDGTMIDDSGRGTIYRELLDKINEHPITGLGAFGGSYAVFLSHNLYYDIFANFGYPIGCMFILYIYYKILVLLKRYLDTDLGDLLMLLGIAALGGGFFTGEFYQTKELWMLFGVFIACAKGRKAVGMEYWNVKKYSQRHRSCV